MVAVSNTEIVLGRGVFGAGDALRLINFRPGSENAAGARVSRQTVSRWLRGYEFEVSGVKHRSAPLWRSDYANDDPNLELSFRDLIELRFVKTFRDAGVSLPTIRRSLQRAAELIEDERPFSTKRFKTDGRTIFLDITRDVEDEVLIDLHHRQSVFRSFVAPSFRDLEFDADVVARWFPLGTGRRTVVVDPRFSFGRPIASPGNVPTEVLANAARVEGSIERAARSYDVPTACVRDAVDFETKLAA